MRYLQTFESFNENTINEILDKISEKGIESLTSAEMDYLKSGGKELNNNDISFKEFKQFFQPIINDYGVQQKVDKKEAYKYFFDYVMFDSISDYKRVEHINPYNVWTILNGTGSKMHLTNGLYRFDRLGYVICDVKWKQGDDYFINL